MSRSVASPDADTPSYCPVRINCTISSDVLPIFTLTWQPVCFWNGCTQSTLGSFCPLSAYPAQAMMLSCPSPLPTDLAVGTSGTAPASADPELPLEHPETTTARAAAAT